MVWKTTLDQPATAEVTLRVKNDIPTYTLRNYRLEYIDNKSDLQSVSLPTMTPGQEYTIVLQNVNDCYNFVVKRSDGSTVIEY